MIHRGFVTGGSLFGLLLLGACQQAYSIRVHDQAAAPVAAPSDAPVPAQESPPILQEIAQKSPEPVPTPEPALVPAPSPEPTAPPVVVIEPSPAPSIAPVPTPEPPQPKQDDRPVICDPLTGKDGKPLKNREHGLKGKIYVLDPSQPRFEDSKDYLQYGRELPLDLFMNDVAVEPRYFREGFKTGRGDLLRTLKGERLLENFGLRLESSLVLSPQDRPGLYEIAILSDDGASLQLLQTDGAVSESLLSFEGAHAPGLGCSSKGIEMTVDSRTPIRLSYFQGPRYQLALMMLWRRVDDAASKRAAEPLCGKFRNDLFFKVTPNSSVPQKAYKQLLERGWRLLKPENFLLSEGRNRC